MKEKEMEALALGIAKASIRLNLSIPRRTVLINSISMELQKATKMSSLKFDDMVVRSIIGERARINQQVVDQQVNESEVNKDGTTSKDKVQQ